MGDFGTHAALVDEVIAWLEDPGVFAATESASVMPELIVLNDLADAVEIANLDSGDRVPNGPTVAWHDITSVFRGYIWRQPLAAAYKGVVHEALKSFWTEQHRRATPALLEQGWSELVEWAQGDLRTIALHRACFGLRSPSFFESLYALYRRGFWPCGWQDAAELPMDIDRPWPTPGRFIVWAPGPDSALRDE